MTEKAANIPHYRIPHYHERKFSHMASPRADFESHAIHAGRASQIRGCDTDEENTTIFTSIFSSDDKTERFSALDIANVFWQ